MAEKNSVHVACKEATNKTKITVTLAESMSNEVLPRQLYTKEKQIGRYQHFQPVLF